MLACDQVERGEWLDGHHGRAARERWQQVLAQVFVGRDGLADWARLAPQAELASSRIVEPLQGRRVVSVLPALVGRALKRDGTVRTRGIPCRRIEISEAPLRRVAGHRALEVPRGRDQQVQRRQIDSTGTQFRIDDVSDDLHLLHAQVLSGS